MAILVSLLRFGRNHHRANLRKSSASVDGYYLPTKQYRWLLTTHNVRTQAGLPAMGMSMGLLVTLTREVARAILFPTVSVNMYLESIALLMLRLYFTRPSQ
jgi:hypothetical protein